MDDIDKFEKQQSDLVRSARITAVLTLLGIANSIYGITEQGTCFAAQQADGTWIATATDPS